MSKIYTKQQILLSSYIGGPIAGCYMLSKNFKVFKQNLERKTLFAGIFFTILLSILIIFIPEPYLEIIPNPLIPLIYTTFIYLYFEQKQDFFVKKHIKNGDEKHSRWNVFYVIILSSILSLLFYITLVIFFDNIIINNQVYLQ